MVTVSIFKLMVLVRVEVIVFTFSCKRFECFKISGDVTPFKQGQSL